MKTKIKDFGKVLAIYIAIYLICSLLFVALFHTPLLKSMEVLMYRGIVLLILAGMVSVALMFLAGKCLCKKKKLLDGKDILLMFCGFCCINMVLFTLIPVTVERSVSVFMLSYMEESPQTSFTEEEIQNAFIDIYVDDFKAFEKRFNEQLVTGSIEEQDDGSYALTKNGQHIVRMFRTVAKWFHTDDRCVYPVTYKK